MTSSYEYISKHGRVCFRPLLIFYLVRLIQLCDKKNLTFVNCRDKKNIKHVLKNVIELAKGELNYIFQDSFNKILSQQLTQDRSYTFRLQSALIRNKIH